MSRASFGGGRMLVGSRGVAGLCRIGFEGRALFVRFFCFDRARVCVGHLC